MGVSKNRGFSPKMDGENNGSKPYEQMDDLGGKKPLFLVQHPYPQNHSRLLNFKKIPHR